MRLCVCFKNKKNQHVLPCQTSHVQSPLDRVDYGGQGLMISAAGLERNSKKDIKLLLDGIKTDRYSWKELIKRKEKERKKERKIES